jgi:hypothetical protein
MKWNRDTVNAAMRGMSLPEAQETLVFFLQAMSHDYSANLGFIYTGQHLDARSWIDGIHEKHIRFSISRPAGARNGILAYLK